MARLNPILGFSVKIVERTGRTLRSHFPQSSLWDGAPCGRDKCITCTQGAEMLPPCTRKSLVYENVCALCNKGAGAKGELTQINTNIPSIYVGETSRTIKERAGEHWAAAQGSKQQKEGSHMTKHMEMYHGGQEPEFVMRVVKFYRSALSRQTGEAVRIAKRGGAGSILNSKSEYNRCYIPRLRVEEQDVIKEMEKLEEQELSTVRELLDEEDHTWAKNKHQIRAEGARSQITKAKGSSTKRSGKEQLNTRRSKKLKYSIVNENWGEKKEGAPEQQMAPPQVLPALLPTSSLPQAPKPTATPPRCPKNNPVTQMTALKHRR